MPRDTQYAVYVSWVKNRETKTTDISAFGDFSSDEDEEPENLFSEDYGHTQGHLTIDGQLSLEAVGRLPVVNVPAHGSTTDVDDFEGYDGLVYQIYLERIDQACGKTLDLSLLFAILETPVLLVTARCRGGHGYSIECRCTHREWTSQGTCLAEILDKQISRT